MIPIYPENFPNIDQNSDTEVIFESLIDGSRWRRTGYCSQCGDCCDDNIGNHYFAEKDGDGNPGGLEQVVPGKCAYFRWGQDGKSLCTGRNTAYYKNGCAYSPSKIEHVMNWPNCTYQFEKIS